MDRRVVDSCSLIAQIDIVQEECAELIVALSKYKRAMGVGYKQNKDRKQVRHNVLKEIAHVTNAMNSLMYKEGYTMDDLVDEINLSDKKSLNLLNDVE